MSFTVADLIKELSKFPPELEVAFPCYHEEKFYPITEIELVTRSDGTTMKFPFVGIGQGFFL